MRAELTGELVDFWVPAELRDPASAARARREFATHLPELLPALDTITAQLDPGCPPGSALLLTGVHLRPLASGCTQAVSGGTLARNYDWNADQPERSVVSSTLLRPVIGMSEGVWGLLDGMNDAGLAVSLTFGGRDVHGPGIAIPLVVRYLLETCDTVDEALRTLDRLPIPAAQNLTLMDGERAVTVHLGPDIAPLLAPGPSAANHQHCPVPDTQERASRTQERLAAVEAAATDPAALVAALLRPPLYESGHAKGYGTLYTAAYRPAEGRVTYHWPGTTWPQSFAAFTPGTHTLTYAPTPGS
ncbi:acyl-coenzyme A--6-aminopenicillanic acid acyl-transferase [Streptomyces hoynatensis]|uniref:Acyl-coenzyme A--6-aminopenicillanic acid acyl-transferase n=1 Tax=Streptomyces hoynatensis TaxID=1141874 RepID=A0A3A9YLW4_9ACTN|nr:acyl-coenzyme A--6-aminopenicillanic acid acyl-transferase [Streptomyces hoynatensis]